MMLEVDTKKLIRNDDYVIVNVGSPEEKLFKAQGYQEEGTECRKGKKGKEHVVPTV